MAAANDNTVKVNEVTKITPFSNSTTEFSLPLTLFDTYWLKFFPVERLFFYQISGLTPDSFNSVILPKLKHSLSLTLLHYLPVAGNLVWPEDATKPAIYYFPNDGVSLTVAESNADFDFLSGNGIRPSAEFRPLTPQLSISDDKTAVLAVQITLFPNQGFCIGISTHHSMFDGRSTVMFMKSWAHLCKQEEENPSLLPQLTPSFDRTVIKDTKGIDLVYANNWLAFTGSDSDPKNRRSEIFSNHSGCEQIDNKQNENEAKQSAQLQTFVLTLAYAFVCMVKAKGGDSNRDVIYAFKADYRSRLNPPLPMNYFGSCSGTHATIAKAGEFMKETGLAFVSEKLSHMVKEIESGLTLEGFEDKLVKLMSMMKSVQGGAQGLGVAGSIRLDVYGPDFGWWKPKKVEIVSIENTGAISLSESRDGGGRVEIGVVLEKQQMEAFASLFVDGLKS
ncbi:phenolic glucoside malonyltransferase 1-like [Melia azedarach]|uniref:Phenolic glucoside malonyltransferase 1-like n=1 Tax=Melia azedarach TaxID=155640 RepID=A0ACC1X8L3_MELAZ|nr:phenolic glucoside malonyltransferase 1-like [Melia azedarach]